MDRSGCSLFRVSVEPSSFGHPVIPPFVVNGSVAALLWGDYIKGVEGKTKKGG